MKEALDVVNKHNLCSYYLLPLIGLNKYSFGILANFKNCHCNPEGTELYVSVYYLQDSIKNHPYLLRTEGSVGKPLYVFRFPEKFLQHFQLFKKGQYSKFTDEIKQVIIAGSGLRYKALNPNGKSITDIRLLAIESDKSRREILRKKLSDYLEVQIAENAELLSPPPDHSFMSTTNPFLTRK